MNSSVLSATELPRNRPETSMTQPSKSILFLRIEPSDQPTIDRNDHNDHNDNDERIPRAFADAGWRSECIDHERVHLVNSEVFAGAHRIADFDRVWLLGLGHEKTFLDRMQLLSLAEALNPELFVNTPTALLLLHGKYRWGAFTPETHAAAHPADLATVIDRGGDWLLKPPAGSFGRGIERIGRDLGNWRQRLATRTASGQRYVLLQRYLPDAQTREKRVLVAGSTIIGAYRRLPKKDAIANNLAQNGEAAPTALLRGERELIETLCAKLTAAGVRFAGIDIVFPFVLEVNLANPGGLLTLQSVYGEDPAQRLVAALGG